MKILQLTTSMQVKQTFKSENNMQMEQSFLERILTIIIRIPTRRR